VSGTLQICIWGIHGFESRLFYLLLWRPLGFSKYIQIHAFILSPWYLLNRIPAVTTLFLCLIVSVSCESCSNDGKGCYYPYKIDDWFFWWNYYFTLCRHVGSLKLRRGISACPRKCCGQVIFTFASITEGWAFSHLEFIVESCK